MVFTTIILLACIVCLCIALGAFWCMPKPAEMAASAAFWRAEGEADADIAAGRVTTFESAEAAVAYLRGKQFDQAMAVPLGGDLVRTPPMADQTLGCDMHFYRPEGCPNCGVKTPKVATRGEPVYSRTMAESLGIAPKAKPRKRKPRAEPKRETKPDTRRRERKG